MNIQTLQRSNYSYFVERQEGIVAYNARTGVVALLKQDIARILRGTEAITALPDALELIEMGFLHNGDEVEQVTSKFDNARQDSKSLNFTILPTLNCNFSCDYCFQGDHANGQHMSSETQIATLSFIRSIILSNQVQNISCTWFGGEPLMAKATVIKMAQLLKDMVDESNAKLYPMSIITNGILLNARTAKDLSDVGIKQAQITFDSLVFQNTKKRGVIDIFGNHSLILKNLIDAHNYLEMDIRVNVSSKNIDEIPKIIEILSENGFEKNYYTARIDDDTTAFATSNQSEITVSSSCGTGGCSSCSTKDLELNDSTILSRRHYGRFEQEYFLKRPENLKRIVKKLTPQEHFCSATLGNMFVIDPAGYISRCWHSAGSPLEAMGNVHDETNSINSTDIAKTWREYSPLAYPSCKSCKVLPLCMGGCSHPRLFMNAVESPCESIKEQVQFCVDTIGRMIELQQDLKV